MINTFTIRFFIFFILCIGSRVAFTILSAFAYGWFLTMLGIIAVFPVVTWFYIIFIGKRDTGFEIFNKKIWWKNLRSLHMFLWAFFAYLAITGNRKAWVVLLIDTLIGISAFILHHQSEGNFKKLLE
jgi:hypothetical protein